MLPSSRVSQRKVPAMLAERVQRAEPPGYLVEGGLRGVWAG